MEEYQRQYRSALLIDVLVLSMVALLIGILGNHTLRISYALIQRETIEGRNQQEVLKSDYDHFSDTSAPIGAWFAYGIQQTTRDLQHKFDCTGLLQTQHDYSFMFLLGCGLVSWIVTILLVSWAFFYHDYCRQRQLLSSDEQPCFYYKSIFTELARPPQSLESSLCSIIKIAQITTIIGFVCASFVIGLFSACVFDFLFSVKLSIMIIAFLITLLITGLYHIGLLGC